MIVEKRQVERSGSQALYQLLLLAVAQADIHAWVTLAEGGDQARQIQRCHGFETADVDLPGDGVVVSQGVLLELVGHLQQGSGLGVETLAAGRQRHTLGMVANEQLHAETFFQALDGRGNGRLGDVQLARGFGNATGLHGGDEVLELSQGIGSHGHLFDAVLGAQGSCLTL
ncbi:hypothetical protein D3C80_1440430 [compost metagenome]